MVHVYNYLVQMKSQFMYVFSNAMTTKLELVSHKKYISAHDSTETSLDFRGSVRGGSGESINSLEFWKI